MSVTAATYRVYVDWNGNGNYDHANSDISSYLISAEWAYGRDYASQLTGKSSAGSAKIVLHNRTSFFSSYNSGSPVWGKALPGRRVKITMAISGGAETIMWAGYLDSLIPSAGSHINEATATLTAHGVLALLSERKVSIAMQTSIKSGAAFGAVMTAAGFSAGQYSADTGQSTFVRYWTKKNCSALEAARDVEESEAGFLRESKDGKPALEDRAHRSSHTVQATYTDTVGQPLRYQSISQEDPLRNIYNVIEANVRTFNISEDVVLWTASNVAGGEGGAPPLIPAASGITPGSLTIYAELPENSSYVAVNQWTQLDYEANGSIDGTGSDLTSDVSCAQTKLDTRMKLVFSNANASAAYLVLLRSHGTGVVEGDPIPVEARDATSIAAYGERTFPFPGKFLADITEAQGFCDHILAINKDPLPIVSLEIAAHSSAARLADAQARDVSDKIHLDASVAKVGLALDGDFYIEHIGHKVERAGTHFMSLQCLSVTAHTWPATAPEYTPVVIVPPIDRVPGDLYANAIANGLKLLFGVQARKWNANIDQAEFRTKFYETDRPQYVDLRTAAEGGSFTDNGTTQIIASGLGANWSGCQYRMTSADQGRWYYAWKLRESVKGLWSVWTDGNDRPSFVRHYVNTEVGGDTGPPADWTVNVVPGPTSGSVVVSASRPATNGKRILGVVFQVKDASTGSWRAIDADAGAADTIYDGSATNHIYNKVDGTIIAASGTYGAAAAGDLILFDVRDSSAGGYSWDKQCCQWGTVDEISGNTISGIYGFNPDFLPASGVYNGVRIKIVRPPWAWNTEGYLGDQPNHGLFEKEFWSNGQQGDVSTSVFESGPIQVPAALAIENTQARVWFQNTYSTADDDQYSDSPPATQEQGLCLIASDNGETISTDARMAGAASQNVINANITGNRILANPTGAVGGQRLTWCIRNTSGAEATITFGDKFRVGQAFSQTGPLNITTTSGWVGDDVQYNLGDPTLSGTWRMSRDGDNLAFQRYSGANWITKGTYSA